MASLIVPKWMRSEFRSDKSPGHGVIRAPAHNKIVVAWVLGWVQGPTASPESEECKSCLKTAGCQIDTYRSAANPNFSVKLRLKISLPTSNEGRD